MDDRDNAPGMGEEQAADLARLMASASEPDAEVAKIEGAKAEAEQAENDGLIAKNAGALAMIFDLAAPTFNQFGFPTVAKVLTDKDENSGMTAGQTLACVWAPVLAHHGVDLSNMSDKYKLEITAVLVTVPIAKALYGAVQADTVGKRARPVAAPAAPKADQGDEQPKAVVLG